MGYSLSEIAGFLFIVIIGVVVVLEAISPMFREKPHRVAIRWSVETCFLAVAFLFWIIVSVISSA